MAVGGKINFAALVTQSKAGGFGSTTFGPQFVYEWILADGTGLNQMDRVYVAQGLTLAAAANADLDLAASLTDFYGAAFTLAKMKLLGVINRSSSPGTITVGRGATNGVTWISAVSAGVVIPAGGANLWVGPSLAAIAVAAGTADLVNVLAAATAGTYTYDVVVGGTSA